MPVGHHTPSPGPGPDSRSRDQSEPLSAAICEKQPHDTLIRARAESDSDTTDVLRETLSHVSFADSALVHALLDARNRHDLILTGPLPHHLHLLLDSTGTLPATASGLDRATPGSAPCGSPGRWHTALVTSNRAVSSHVAGTTCPSTLHPDQLAALAALGQEWAGS